MPSITKNESYRNAVSPKGEFTQEELSQGKGGGVAVDFISIALAEYAISDTDEGGDPEYFGFVAADGSWYIMAITGAVSENIRYAKGDSNYDDAWDLRATHAYGRFDNVF